MSEVYLQVIQVANSTLNSSSNNTNLTSPTEILTAFCKNVRMGMINKSKSKSGAVVLNDTFEIKTVGNYINGFKFETENRDDVSRDDDYTDTNNSVVNFVIIQNNSTTDTTFWGIYSTTGNIFYNREKNVIYTSANSFFKKVDANSEYVPHWGPLNGPQGGIESGKPDITKIRNVETIKEISNLITSETGNVIYYLNCLSDAFRNVTIKDSTVLTNVLTQFLSILMVKIVLDPNDYNMNNEFLKEMDRNGIKTDVIKQPVKDILSKMNSEKNPYQIYINGLDFPLLLLKMRKFESIIKDTYNNYKILLETAKKFIIANDQNGKAAKDLIQKLLDDVQTKTQCAECFVMFNSRKTVNGGLQNERFYYKIETTDDGREYIRIDAAESMKRLYDKDGFEIPDAKDAENEKKRFIPENGKKLINIDGGPGNRNLKGIFGPFRKVYETRDSSGEITNGKIAKSPEMNELLTKLINEGILFIIGWGASGAGKTSKLVYFNKGETRDEQIGVIIQMCNLFKTTYNDEVGDVLEVKRVEVCPKPEKKDGKISQGEYECKEDTNTYTFNWTNDSNGLNFICEKETKFDANNTERLAREKVQCEKDDGNPNNGEYKDCDIGGKSLGEVAELFIDKDRHVNATTNNQNSSRSHSLLFLKFMYKKEPKVIVIGDFAGVENVFSCDDLQVYIDFANLNVDKTTATATDPDKKYYNDPISKYATEDRQDIYKFMEGENLYQYIGDKKGGGKSNVTPDINVTKEIWVKNLKTMLKGCDSDDNISPTKCFLDNYANGNSYDEITRIKNLFEPPNTNIEYPIVGQIINAVITFNNNKSELTLPQVSGWFDNKNNNITEYNLHVIRQNKVLNSKRNDEDNINEYGYDKDTTINLNHVVSLLNLHSYDKQQYIKISPNSDVYTFTKSTHTPCSNNSNNCFPFIYKNSVFCHIITGSYKCLIVDNKNSDPKKPGVKFVLNKQNIEIYKLQNAQGGGVTTTSEPIEAKYQSKPDLNVLENIFTVQGFTDFKIDKPMDETTFDKYKNKTNEPLKDDIKKWKTGTSTSILFYAIGATKYNGEEYKLPVKVTINKPYDSFATQSNDPDQKKADGIVKKWGITDKSKINEAKDQFITDLENLYNEIQRHAQVKKVAQKYCNLRTKEGKFINSELALLTKAVDACYSLKNSGQPLMPKNIPGVNDFFEGRHIFKVLDKVVYNVDSFKEVVNKSMIMKAIFDTCEKFGMFDKPSQDDNSSNRAGTTSEDINKSNSNSNQLENYKSFSTMLSVVYFLVFDLSRSAEKDNKIQYININPLFNLLTEVEYDMELEELGLVDFENEKQKEYVKIIKYTIANIKNYFESNGISTTGTVNSKGSSQGLKVNGDVSSMFQAIEGAMRVVEGARSYPAFHIALLGLIDTIDSINMTTSIGTLQTVSRRMNGIKKLVIPKSSEESRDSQPAPKQERSLNAAPTIRSNAPTQEQKLNPKMQEFVTKAIEQKVRNNESLGQNLLKSKSFKELNSMRKQETNTPSIFTSPVTYKNVRK